jgi:CxxC motif-containing protein (DUF1111 family)
MRPIPTLPFFALAAMPPERRAAILAPTADFLRPEAHEDLPGGSATNRKRLDREDYSQPFANLSFAERADFFVGNGLFRRIWVTSPSSTKGADGLGPLYNARGCQRCHLRGGWAASADAGKRLWAGQGSHRPARCGRWLSAGRRTAGRGHRPP